ncbi:uracil-DNA glycosylase isoform X2 [Sceloporus undulatus]|uniref:uracil-DNA glycosylase isoform X2 n=1 Tax=Sceloporus undulatus TaxID=8520 RepID=UPI001C4C4EA4|nr:uracil-DNA glycosylase isoform X2 [Sceloporus undulatus]
MIGQRTLRSFFSPLPAGEKRSRVSEPNQDAEEAPKRPKANSTSAARWPPATAAAALTPEQLERIRKNKEAAQQRLASRTVVVSAAPEMAPGWKAALAPEFAKPYFPQLMAYVAEERRRYTVYPPPDQVFTWTQMCDVRDVKVVILGQDPYHGPGQAHGLCFSVQRPVPPPPSLENIYKELTTDIEGFSHPGHGDLTGWAKQGVLLLNAVLTVRMHQPNSHKEKGWELLTDAAVSWLDKNLDGLVFLLWGAYAQKKGGSINRKRHHILPTAHPSPLSAHRGFFGCKHFSKANELLRKSGKEPIDWGAL